MSLFYNFALVNGTLEKTARYLLYACRRFPGLLPFAIYLAAAGIAAPFALEAVLRRPDARACACIGVLVLIGGFFLRYCLCTAPFMDIASYL